MVFVTTIIGLVVLLLVPIIVRNRAEWYHDEIDTRLTPARDQIRSTLEVARDAEQLAVQEYTHGAKSSSISRDLALVRYRQVVENWRRLAARDAVVEPAGPNAITDWHAGVSDLRSWLERVGPQYISRSGQPMGNLALPEDALFQSGALRLRRARMAAESKQTEVRNRIVDLNNKQVVVGTPLALTCLALAALAWNSLHCIRRAESRLETALRELNHRVKNNLQSVGALIDVQKMESTEPAVKGSLEELAQQVQAMAAVHDLMSNTRSTGIAGAVRCDDLLQGLAVSSGRAAGIAVAVEAATVPLGTSAATALALVANELLLNSGKHGATEAVIRFRSDGMAASLVVQDNGPGFSPAFDLNRDANLGLALVQTLVRHDLGGSIQFSSVDGARVHVTFPVAHR